MPRKFVDCPGMAFELSENGPKSAEVLVYLRRQSDSATLEEIQQGVPGAEKNDAERLLTLELVYKDGKHYRLNKGGKCVADCLI